MNYFQVSLFVPANSYFDYFISIQICFIYNNNYIIIITIRPRGIALVGGLPLARPLGTATVTWLGHWELQDGTATALGVCPPTHPTLSMTFFWFPSPLFGVSRRNFEKMHPPDVISGRQTITLGLHVLPAVNRLFVNKLDTSLSSLVSNLLG